MAAPRAAALDDVDRRLPAEVQRVAHRAGRRHPPRRLRHPRRHAGPGPDHTSEPARVGSITTDLVHEVVMDRGVPV